MFLAAEMNGSRGALVQGAPSCCRHTRDARLAPFSPHVRKAAHEMLGASSGLVAVAAAVITLVCTNSCFQRRSTCSPRSCCCGSARFSPLLVAVLDDDTSAFVREGSSVVLAPRPSSRTRRCCTLGRWLLCPAASAGPLSTVDGIRCGLAARLVDVVSAMQREESAEGGLARWLQKHDRRGKEKKKPSHARQTLTEGCATKGKATAAGTHKDTDGRGGHANPLEASGGSAFGVDAR